MGITHKQWKSIAKDDLVVSVAPFAPAEIAHNRKYVLTSPPRFYYDFATGYEEVLKILGTQMRAFAPRKNSRIDDSLNR